MTREQTAIIQKSHELVNAKYDFTLQEIRVFHKLLTMIDANDTDFKKYAFKASDFIKEFNIKSKDIYSEFDTMTDSLLKKIIKIPKRNNGKEKIFKTALVSSFSYYKDGSGMIECTIHPDLKPYLLQLKSRFLRYDLKNVLKLSSTHCVRLYELLKQFETSGFRLIDLQELKELLGVEKKYDRYYNFKIKILDYAQKNLAEHTDIAFVYEEIRKAGSVSQIRFLIQRKEAAEEGASVSASILTLLSRRGLENDAALALHLTQRPEPVVLTARQTAEKRMKTMRPRLPGAYLRKLLMNPGLFEKATEKQQQKLFEVESEVQIEALKQRFLEELAAKTADLRTEKRTQEEDEAFNNQLAANPLHVKFMSKAGYVQQLVDRHLQKAYLTPAEYDFGTRKLGLNTG